MYEVMNGFLSDKKGGEVFTCFGLWHWIYIGAILGIILIMVLLLKNSGRYERRRAAEILINCAFGLYVLDFFLMPFAYGEIDIEKLPFHACTAMCVMCFISRHSRAEWLQKYRIHFALLGLISNLVYVIYPAGIGWQEIHPLCYRTVQTLLFHGLMTGYGIVVLAFDEAKLEWRTWYRELPVLAGMTLWALLGNTLYNGIGGDYSYHFNWFFVVKDPFGILPLDIAKWVMPFLTPLLFLAVEMVVYGVRRVFVHNSHLNRSKR